MLSKQENNLFYHISHSHLYWGRKPISGLSRVLEGLRSGDIFLDPFCGGGTSIVTALGKGARVIASDLNPMAVFLSKVLVQPISVFALKEAFEAIRDDVAESIFEKYTISCPKCGRQISFDYLKWNSQNGEEMPEAVKVTCNYCSLKDLRQLSKDEINRQLKLSAIQPKRWFPKAPIRSQRKTKVEFFHELFTGRNLTSLSELWNAIEKIPSARCKDALKYVFTAMLYSCSSMQMFSKKRPSSSRGWTALRFYLPSIRQEKNVWQAFKNRFETVLKAKEKINPICKFVRISDSMDKFESSDDNVFIYEKDFSEFSFPKRLDVNHVFLDPPYSDDIDYMGFSEFWSSWLGMDSDIQAGWHPGIITVEENAERLLKLLLRISENTTSSCLTTLAYGSKSKVAWELLNKTISQAGYEILEEIPILWDNSQKRGKTLSTDRYLLLQRASKKAKIKGYKRSDEYSNELIFFVKVAAFLRPDISNPEGIVDLAVNLVKPHLRIPLRQVNKSLIRLWTSDSELNRRAYNRLAFVFIKLILSQDGFRIVSADANQFDDTNINGYDEIDDLAIPQGLAMGADFLAENDKGNRIIFCFYNESKVNVLKRISKRIFAEDDDNFRKICYLIISNHKTMMKCRQAEWADNWPRGFFIKFNKLVKKAKQINAIRFGHITMMSTKSDIDFRTYRKIEHFKAKVLKNTAVGSNGDPKHFIMKFKTPELKYVVPGQFVMVDTLPYDKRKGIDRGRPIHSLAKLISHSYYSDMIELTPSSYLKRPFSIHRAFYKNFKWNYLKNMSLPPALASITHTVFPQEFEIFYKLVESGTGTNELKEIKQGDTFQVLGPLGKNTTISDWRSHGVEEVHLIGGGVGMAPLMFFGQALKYYSFSIKAFIGIDRLDTLLDQAQFPESFADDPQKAYVYIDNLLQIGLVKDDIHVSYEKKDTVNHLNHKISGIHYFNGLVSHQYQAYIDKLNAGNILVITCGPIPMLKALAKITSKSRIPMKVLLEKRMGCGIGVCMSCVCRTKKNSGEQYARVCMEGPLFDSEEIVWEKL